MKFPKVLLAAVLMLPVSGVTQESVAMGPGLAPGDQVAVHFYDFPDMQTAVSVHVNGDGTVHLPYAGTLKAQGLTPDQLQAAITDTLKTRGIVKDPNVTVDVLMAVNMSVAVIGEVLKPTSVPLYAPAPVSYILTQAGGITSMASPHVTILHPGGVDPTSIDYERNSPSSDALRTLVRPGDIVHVASSGVYYIGGEVNRPGIYPVTGVFSTGAANQNFGIGLTKKLTLLGAIAQAGGITSIASRSQMRLLRTVDGKREEIKIDQVKLYKGEIADPLILPEDIIYIPSSYIRSQTNNLFGTAITSVYAATEIHSF